MLKNKPVASIGDRIFTLTPNIVTASSLIVAGV